MKYTTKDQWNRRKVLTRSLGFVGAGALLGTQANALWFGKQSEPDPTGIPGITTREQYRGYSNGYEFGQSKNHPLKYEDSMDVSDWHVNVGQNNLTLDELRGRPFEDLQSEYFNFRCVERWSMNVNYNGFPLSEILEEFGDTSKKYVAFTCVQQDGLPGQNRRGFDWPYVEAYTMEEALSPLTWAVFGNYGEPSVANGSPFRVNCPWKLGFKSPKWVVDIQCTDTKPPATWNMISSSEYGWYSNVYPDIPHPRWSQANERFITSEGTENRSTVIYNGYQDQVEHMYPGDNYQYR